VAGKWSYHYGYSAVFPLWALLLSVLAFFSTGLIRRLKTQIVPLLDSHACYNGVTLAQPDFKQVLKTVKAVGVGCYSAFLVMPIGVLVWRLRFGLITELTVVCVWLAKRLRAGTSSNVMCYLGERRIPRCPISMNRDFRLDWWILNAFLSGL